MVPEIGNERQWDIRISCSQQVAAGRGYRRLPVPMIENY